MKERRSKSERVAASSRSASNPVEIISSGAAAGVWLLDPSSSRIEVWAAHVGRFVSLRGQVDRFKGQMEIGRSIPPSGSLTVDASSVRCRKVWRSRGLFGDEFFVTLDDPTVTFRSEHVFLVAPDQVWVIGTLAGGGRSASVAFEATVTLEFPYGCAVVDATIVAPNLALPDESRPRHRAKATCTMHLVFLRQY